MILCEIRICFGGSKISLVVVLQWFHFDMSPNYCHAPYHKVTMKPKYKMPMILECLWLLGCWKVCGYIVTLINKQLLYWKNKWKKSQIFHNNVKCWSYIDIILLPPLGKRLFLYFMMGLMIQNSKTLRFNDHLHEKNLELCDHLYVYVYLLGWFV